MLNTLTKDQNETSFCHFRAGCRMDPGPGCGPRGSRAQGPRVRTARFLPHQRKIHRGDAGWGVGPDRFDACDRGADQVVEFPVRPDDAEKVRTKVQALVAQLGSPHFTEREAAQAAILRIGPAAAAHLSAYEQDPDPEVHHRVRAILESLGSEWVCTDRIRGPGFSVEGWLEGDSIGKRSEGTSGRVDLRGLRRAFFDREEAALPLEKGSIRVSLVGGILVEGRWTGDPLFLQTQHGILRVDPHGVDRLAVSDGIARLERGAEEVSGTRWSARTEIMFGTIRFGTERIVALSAFDLPLPQEG